MRVVKTDYAMVAMMVFLLVDESAASKVASKVVKWVALKVALKVGWLAGVWVVKMADELVEKLGSWGCWWVGQTAAMRVAQMVTSKAEQ